MSEFQHGLPDIGQYSEFIDVPRDKGGPVVRILNIHLFVVLIKSYVPLFIFIFTQVAAHVDEINLPLHVGLKLKQDVSIS